MNELSFEVVGVRGMIFEQHAEAVGISGASRVVLESIILRVSFLDGRRNDEDQDDNELRGGDLSLLRSAGRSIKY